MPRISLQTKCPKGRDRGVRLKNGTWGRSSCNSYNCPVCGRHDLKRKAAVLTHVAMTAPHAKWVTLTLAPRSEAARKAAVINFRAKLERKVGRIELAWVTEVGMLGGWHIHALIHGQPLDSWTIEEAWGARVKVKDTHTGVGWYMLKNGLECPGSTNRWFHFQINAGRPFRHSRGFYGEATTFDEAWRITRESWTANGETPAEPRTPTPVVALSILINSTRE